nr:hypothetical protein BaRGS_022033 [Batillaria attramentaria]
MVVPAELRDVVVLETDKPASTSCPPVLVICNPEYEELTVLILDTDEDCSVPARGPAGVEYALEEDGENWPSADELVLRKCGLSTKFHMD